MSSLRALGAVAVLLVFAACSPSPDPGRTLYVLPGEGGEWDDSAAMAQVSGFTTIQDAVDTASPGDTVEIPSGTFNEFVVLTPGVSLHGAGQGQTIVNGRIKVTGDGNLTISALTVECVSSVGVHLEAALDVVVADVEVTGCNAGMLLEDVSTNILIDDVYLHGNAIFGVELQVVEQSTISNSLIESNGYGGIYATYTYDVTARHNTIVGNGFSGAPASNQGGVDLDEEATVVLVNNIITGNTRGIECIACFGTWFNNLVWGNVVDYAGGASEGPGDLAVDPGFVAASEGDYHLTAGSPAIDAADPAYSVGTDSDGEARPSGPAPDLGLDEYVESGLSLLITEVMANPLSELQAEFVEVLNTGTSGVDLAGLHLTDGDRTDELISFDGSPTMLAPGDRAVILDSQYSAQYVIDPAVVLLTSPDVSLGNGLTTSDPVTLLEVDALTVIATASFPSDPGDGVSLEMTDEALGDVNGNWQPSQCASGSSPGGPACLPDVGDPAALVITEVLANPLAEATGEFVELWNPSIEVIDAAGLVMEDGGGHDDVLEGLDGGTALIPSGAHALIVDSGWVYAPWVAPSVVLLTTGDATLGNGLSITDTVTLFATDGATVIDSFTSPSNPGDGISVERIDYGGGDTPSNWQSSADSCITGHSAGRLNGAAGGTCGPLVINEVMSNPLVESTGEFVELWNADADAIELAGLVLGDGDTAEPLLAFEGGPTSLSGGGFAVVVDSGTPDAASLPAGTVVMTTPNATLGNALSTDDVISLFEADGSTVIDSFGFPFNPGNGVSVERIAIEGVPDSETNWIASPCAAGASAGFANCVTSGEVGGDLSDIDILITEVMSNPTVEYTGEYVELYNAGPDAVNLFGTIIWDGDASDPLEGFADPLDAVLDPGGWAVILDSGYAGQYTIPADALLLTTDDAAIASGLALDDDITLFEPDGLTVIATFSWSMDAGDGNSVERLNLSIDDLSTNWAPASCGPTPGGVNCPP